MDVCSICGKQFCAAQAQAVGVNNCHNICCHNNCCYPRQQIGGRRLQFPLKTPQKNQKSGQELSGFLRRLVDLSSRCHQLWVWPLLCDTEICYMYDWLISFSRVLFFKSKNKNSLLPVGSGEKLSCFICFVCLIVVQK